MLKRLIGPSLLLALFVLPALDVLAQDKKKKDQTGEAKDSAKMKAGVYVGLLKSVPGTDRIFVVEVETKTVVPNKNNTNRLTSLSNQLAAAQRQLLGAKNLQQRQNALNRIASLQKQILTAKANVKYKKEPVEFQTTETVKTRTMLKPEEFDEKGNVKKYTPAELAKLKGKDKNLEGYESSLEKLEAGQKVKVILVLASKKPAPKESDKDSDKDKDKDPDEKMDKKMQVKRIVILEESKGTGPKGKGRKKK